MRCPECGHEVPPPLLLCPACGAHVEQTQPVKKHLLRARREKRSLEETVPVVVPTPQPETPSARPTLWRRARVVLLALLAFLCLVTLSIAVAGYSGLHQGEVDRLERRLALADEHYRRGLERLDSGEYLLAIAEFEYCLQLNPDHPLAAQGIAEAQVRMALIPTPTSQAVVDITGELFANGTAAYEAEDWETAARLLSQLRAFAPDYEREAVEEMLFQSLRNQGLALLEEDRFEEGIFYLDQAQMIRSLDANDLLELELANRYIAALSYWNLDWDRCIQRFEELYRIYPGYKDVFSRLYQANVLYGDAWFEQGEMCPAAVQYARALELVSNEEVQQKWAHATELCAIATPTPVPPITGTLPISGTIIVPNFTGGRLAYSAYDAQTGVYDVYAILPGGELVRMVSGADQPCWQWGTDRLAYRNRLAGTLAFVQPGGQAVTLPAGAGGAWPSFSPDGSRYAYAAPDSTRVWYVYIARTDGAGEPVRHALGWGPIWGPNGLLAWTGCESVDTDCGIFVDNPDDGQAPVRLTASIDDSGIHWSPGGDWIVYMSDQGGSWDLYLLGVNGGVQPLTADENIDGLPAWSPDGSAIAFLSYRNSRWGIYLIQPDGSNLRQMIDLGPEMPAWWNQRLSWAP